MYHIAYVIPYFGKFREDINIWLLSVAYNPTISWIIFTDDNSPYDWPNNVHVFYTTFEKIKKRIQSLFDFEISLDRPYKLCDFKVTYGELFEQELREYDFWGYCDMDLMWGGIERFLTKEILDQYDKIGFQGHSTLYRNTKENNSRYRIEIPGRETYRSVFTSSKSCNFDEKGINGIYNAIGVPFYSETIFSTLAQYRHNFIARYWPKENVHNNKNVVYIWEAGKLFHVSAYRGNIFKQEVMYVHWQKRRMELACTRAKKCIVIIPNKIQDCNTNLTYDYIWKVSRANWISYFMKILKKIKELQSYFT